MQPVLAGGRIDLVDLDPDHPGFRDGAYRVRRNAIAELALRHRPGDSLPLVDYLPEEHAVWRTVQRELRPLHDRYAAASFHRASTHVRLPEDRIPQLAEIDAQIFARTEMRLSPVAGLIASRDFLSALGRSTFLATQYIRHYSRPLYTPEPDVIHELVGHAVTLADDSFAALNRAFGAAAMAADDARLEAIARVYWTTLEFGAVREGSALKVYGAGLLSSIGELSRFETHAELRPFDLEEMAALPYDPTSYQAKVFVAPSFGEMTERLLAWLTGY